jgi:hypothetical protein
MNFSAAFIEVGSTNTKGFIYKNNKIRDLPILNITFKKNYLLNKELLYEDKIKLFNFINEVKNDVETVYIFGTSIFRDLNNKQKKDFLDEFKKATGFEFTICSLEDENKYTVYGAIKNLNYKRNVAVLVVGGGSVEISICKDNKIIESVNTSFGVMDLYKKFSDIKENYATSNRDEIVNYIKEYLNLPKEKADILILAGGNHLLYHEAAKYPLQKNRWFDDEMHPYMIESEEKFNYDLKYYYNISLESLRAHTPNNPNWWNETRGICAFTKCVSDTVKAEYIIPTKINMMYHILDEIKKQKNNDM